MKSDWKKGWISAEEKPSDDRRVLVLLWRRSGKSVIAIGNFEFGRWSHYQTTHWMELPDKPEGGE